MSHVTLVNTSTPYIVAIDGPAASGKGTLARKLADLLGLAYLDTGRLYRAVASRLIQQDVDFHNPILAAATARTISLEDIKKGQALSNEEVGKIASIVSAMPEVREALLEVQRNFAQTLPGAVLDGRDIGTVILP